MPLGFEGCESAVYEAFINPGPPPREVVQERSSPFHLCSSQQPQSGIVIAILKG